MAARNIEKNAAQTAENDAVVAKEKKSPQFKVEKLRANSMKLFKVTTSTFDGAMHGRKESEMTIAEARAIIDKWLGRKE